MRKTKKNFPCDCLGPFLFVVLSATPSAHVSANEYRVLGKGCCRAPLGLRPQYKALRTDDDATCQAACTNLPECQAAEWKEISSACKLHTTEITRINRNGECVCSLKASPTTQSADYHVLGQGRCQDAQGITYSDRTPIRTVKSQSVETCMADCSITDKCSGFEWVESGSSNDEWNCLLLNVPIAHSSGDASSEHICFLRTASPRNAASSPSSLPARASPLSSSTRQQESGNSAPARPALSFFDRDRRAADQPSKARRYCSGFKPVYLKYSETGKYVLAGPPAEGWIIAGDTKGWWERWEIRQCERDDGGHVYLIKSLAHGHFLRSMPDGSVLITRDFAGPEEEFTLEKDPNSGDETSARHLLRAWDGKYLVVSPSGGVRAVRKYYARPFELEPVPEETIRADQEAATKMQQQQS